MLVFYKHILKLKTNILAMRNKSTLALYTYLFSISILLFSSSKVIAQENGFYELKENSSKNDSREAFYDLAYKLLPTAYIENNNIKIGGNSGYANMPISKLTFNDTKSFNILNQPKPNLNKVELITIKVLTPNDLNNSINLSEVEGLNRLKYILIDCYFECTESQIKAFVKLDNPNVRIFYKTNKPS